MSSFNFKSLFKTSSQFQAKSSKINWIYWKLLTSWIRKRPRYAHYCWNDRRQKI